MNHFDDLVKACEIIRYKKGLGIQEFCAQIGIAYRSYFDFINYKRKTQPRTMSKIMIFLEREGRGE